MLTVYGRATSSNVQIVMWAIGELGLEHERLDYGFNHGGVDTPQYLALNPNGTVPTIKDGDLVIWESAAILRYLAAKYGDDTFWPSDISKRAQVDKWAEWGKLNIALIFTGPIFWARVRTAAKDRDTGAMARGIKAFDAKLDILADQIGDNPFVMGAHFTTADIIVGHILYRWFDIDVPRKPNPIVEAYYQRLTERPAYRDHVMVDYSVLAVEGH